MWTRLVIVLITLVTLTTSPVHAQTPTLDDQVNRIAKTLEMVGVFRGEDQLESRVTFAELYAEATRQKEGGFGAEGIVSVVVEIRLAHGPGQSDAAVELPVEPGGAPGQPPRDAGWVHGVADHALGERRV